MCTLIIGCLWALAACDPDVVRPGLEPPDAPALTQSPEPVDVQVAPAGDTYVSRALPPQNFGADTLLLLDGDHRPLVRWDSAALAEAIGNGSLLEARLELIVLSNSGGWPGNARWVALHAMSEEWVEEEASWDCSSADPAPCDPWSMDEPEELEGPQGPYHSPWNPQATDSLRVMNNTDGVVTFDVTSDVVAALQGGVYRHGWLLKRVNESTGGALEIGAREGGSAPRLVLTVELPEQVPFTPPDSLPSQAVMDSLYSPENMVYDFRIGYIAPRNVLFVGFHPQASEQERQEAIDLVDGVVIGGMPVAPGVGLYMLRIPHDGTAEPLVQALEALRSLPQVQFAHANPPPIEPSHRKPHDGTGWEAGDWNPDPDSANGANWGPEAIAAPLAWGCETGSVTTRVDLIDTNVGAAPHGSLVSAILGEPGDSGAQTPGIMGESSRILHDFLDPLPPAGQRPLAMLARLDQVVRGMHGLEPLDQSGRYPEPRLESRAPRLRGRSGS